MDSPRVLGDESVTAEGPVHDADALNTVDPGNEECGVVEDEKPRLRTRVSQAYWCQPEQEKEPPFSFDPAEWSKDEGGKAEKISWLDRLLEDGIVLPDGAVGGGEASQAVTMLVTGPPGSGKSVLCMELCHNWAEQGLTSLYVSTESPGSWIQFEADSFGFTQFGEGKQRIVVRGNESLVDGGGRRDLADYVRSVTAGALDPGAAPGPRNIVVVDSLNLFAGGQREELLEDFLAVAKSASKLIIFVVETGTDGQQRPEEFWKYVSDITISLGRTYSGDFTYMLRTIEIEKARYQGHVWGKHLLKIYPKPTESFKTLAQARGQHPYLKERGGIFIYPSIHYHLSTYKHQRPERVRAGLFAQPSPPALRLTTLETLREMLPDGLPIGRCTAFIGIRGGHKSHLGYFHLLSRLRADPEENVLVISLRDDEEMAKDTMQKILLQQFPRRSRNRSTGATDLSDFERRGRLEILHFPPGYIAPEEFVHRVYMSIRRMKAQRSGPITVLFNSLDQLLARFPLCAKESIFVPGLIDILNAEAVTSIFVAVSEPGQPAEQYGLLPMADLILSFSHRRFRLENFQRLAAKDPKLNLNAWATEPSDRSVQAVVLRVARLHRAQAAGARGMLELVDKRFDRDSILSYPGRGLHFTVFPPDFEEGDPVKE